jgi:hypothetical protein
VTPYWLTAFVRGERPVGSMWRTMSATKHVAVLTIATQPVMVKTAGPVTKEG